ncbi:hypothetical protein CONPUDRAFT_140049 [Coniophora puteana RWD-64-598 SS2]|uniref:Geranylgeranyl pyrophosphate synthetase n=1 Tax=Coniophora puteana (strain RWD-64-598) TaxID=741705 RepID=A0A5M3MA24_CONPW|nr:uncharacterized protein CONPUDRAFT_140049 [Coniophora puteana RWD-64-598 SS2]EIW75640.1 hypothetical protein CONPUDRAFT_140049 [Coniophora puteana RWD-64-598 SS2]
MPSLTGSTSTPVYVKEGLEAALMQFGIPDSITGVTKHVRPVGSYSWVTGSTPTIVVPGSPSIWTNSRVRRVMPDTGVVVHDENAHHMGRHASPLTPIFAALDALYGADENLFRYADLDLVTDRANLEKLLRFIMGADTEAFRIDVERGGQAVLFTGCEPRVSDRIVGFQGYGRSYQKAAASPAPGCEAAGGHYRLNVLTLGGLRILLRFPVAACLSAPSSLTPDSPLLSGHVHGLTVRLNSPPKLVAQSQLVELRFTTSRRPLDWAETFPALSLSRTPWLFVANHSTGVFNEPEKVELSSEKLAAHAEKAETSLCKLKLVIAAVLAVVRMHDERVPMSLVREGKKLTLYRRKMGTGSMLDDQILRRFWK